MIERAQPLGRLTEEEILSQPNAWRTALRRCQEYFPEWRRTAAGPAALTFFVGCGTSYYLAEAAAAAWRALAGGEARAVPASELLLFPELYLRHERSDRFVLISRSGATTEVVKAAQFCAAEARAQVLAFTCREGSELAAAAAQTFVFPEGFDRSVVMTRSFTTMLAALIAFAGAEPASLAPLPEAGEALLRRFAPVAEQWGSRDTAAYVFLGQGPLYGLAREAALKMKEMSLTASEPFHSLEVRHGPKSVIAARSAVVVLSSAASRQWEEQLLRELAQQGAATLRIDEEDGDCALASGLDLYRRLPLYVLPCQLLALMRARAQGVDSDRPRALSAVVEVRLA